MSNNKLSNMGILPVEHGQIIKKSHVISLGINETSQNHLFLCCCNGPVFPIFLFSFSLLEIKPQVEVLESSAHQSLSKGLLRSRRVAEILG